MRQSTSITGCVRWLVCRSVTHSFEDPHVAPIGLLGLVLQTRPYFLSDLTSTTTWPRPRKSRVHQQRHQQLPTSDFQRPLQHLPEHPPPSTYNARMTDKSTKVTNHLDVNFRSDFDFLCISVNHIVDINEEAVCDIHLVSHGDVLLPCVCVRWPTH